MTPTCKILVVDDNVDAANSLVELLAVCGYPACAIYEGREAVLLAEVLRPTLVLMDIDMPGMDGFDTAACMLRAAADMPPRLVALTGRSSDRDRSLSASAGFDLHLCKPIRCEQLCELAEVAYQT